MEPRRTCFKKHQPSVEMSSAETTEEEKGDDIIIDMNGATLNQLKEALDIVITENNFQAIPLAVADKNTQESVQILLGCVEGDNTTDRYSSSISLVPNILRDHTRDSFNPMVVSIGPVHHESKILKESEGFKRKCMRNLLGRSGCPPEETLAACLRKVNESIQKIRACYVGIRPYNYSDHELARMMVIDGCFILEFQFIANNLNDLLEGQICRDLLLVENQIPFFVLNHIFECTILKFKPRACVGHHISRLLCYGNDKLFKGHLKMPHVLAHTIDHDHILGFLHKCYRPEFTMSSGACSLVCSLVELEKAGVSFKPNQDVSWPLAINIEWSRYAWFSWFWVKPTLRIPEMIIEDDTETILRNIIAYEQTTKVVPYFSSYASAIDDLVDSPRDIAKLVESNIITNLLGSNEEAAKMINNICKNVNVCNYYFKQWQEVETYYNGYWPRHIAWLRRTYFNNPWNLITLLAGIILFSLTMIQTYFTINPRK